jgi:hypothetical protein
MFPEAFDPVLFGVLSAAVEEEYAAAYEAGFSDGLRSAAWGLPDEVDDLGPPVDEHDVAPAGDRAPAPLPFEAAKAAGDDGSPLVPTRGQ